jgi:uncharacterized protein YgbK (DUF1537 family)
MLVRAGLRVVQVFGTKSSADLRGADAVVVSLKSRSIPAADAVQESLRGLAFLQSMGARRFFFEYCSTFDSTPAGNIGPVAEALAGMLGQDQVWYVPSFPENGRTVYCGHLFVNRVLLNESGMKDHPLNPMTDSSLMRVLQKQCRAPVDVLMLDEIRGADLRRAAQPGAARHWIVDAIGDDDLRQIARLACNHVLLTGGSAIARYWAECASNFADATVLTPAAAHVNLPAGPAVVLAGSCSEATRRQIASFAAAGFPVLPLDVLAAAGSQAEFDEVVSRAVSWYWRSERRFAAIASGADPDCVAGTVAQLGEKRASQLTEALFAAIAKQLAAQGVNRLVVAGGETSGAVINALGVDAIRIGAEIAPGVPCVYPVNTPSLSLALKSGNFGGADFFLDALRQLTAKGV